MNNRPIRPAAAIALAALALALATPALAAKTRVEARIAKVVDSKTLIVVVEKGDHRGRWSLTFDTPLAGPEEGAKVGITADESVFKARKGKVSASFTRSDEELQAIIDWLGSLE
jgi:hypothetical protein